MLKEICRPFTLWLVNSSYLKNAGIVGKIPILRISCRDRSTSFMILTVDRLHLNSILLLPSGEGPDQR